VLTDRSCMRVEINCENSTLACLGATTTSSSRPRRTSQRRSIHKGQRAPRRRQRHRHRKSARLCSRGHSRWRISRAWPRQSMASEDQSRCHSDWCAIECWGIITFRKTKKSQAEPSQARPSQAQTHPTNSYQVGAHPIKTPQPIRHQTQLRTPRIH